MGEVGRVVFSHRINRPFDCVLDELELSRYREFDEVEKHIQQMIGAADTLRSNNIGI